LVSCVACSHASCVGVSPALTRLSVTRQCHLSATRRWHASAGVRAHCPAAARARAGAPGAHSRGAVWQRASLRRWWRQEGGGGGGLLPAVREPRREVRRKVRGSRAVDLNPAHRGGRFARIATWGSVARPVLCDPIISRPSGGYPAIIIRSSTEYKPIISRPSGGYPAIISRSSTEYKPIISRTSADHQAIHVMS